MNKNELKRLSSLCTTAINVSDSRSDLQNQIVMDILQQYKENKLANPVEIEIQNSKQKFEADWKRFAETWQGLQLTLVIVEAALLIFMPIGLLLAGITGDLPFTFFFLCVTSIEPLYILLIKLLHKSIQFRGLAFAGLLGFFACLFMQKHKIMINNRDPFTSFYIPKNS